MKKSDKLKEDLTAYSFIVKEILDLEMVFVERNGVLHAKHYQKTYGTPCRFMGDGFLTTTGLLNVFDNLDKVCPRCVDSISFDGSSKSVLNDLVRWYSYLLTVNKNFEVAEETLTSDHNRFSDNMSKADSLLASAYTYGLLNSVPTYGQGSSFKPYEKVFIKIYETQKKRSEDIKSSFKDFVTSDDFEKQFLFKIAERIFPIPPICKKNTVAKVLIPEVKKLREKLVEDESWSLFFLYSDTFKYTLHTPGVVLLQKYETKHGNLFHAPQIYLDYAESITSYNIDSARFKGRLTDEMLENIVGIYDARGTGHNSKLSRVISTAKII